MHGAQVGIRSGVHVANKVAKLTVGSAAEPAWPHPHSDPPNQTLSVFEYFECGASNLRKEKYRGVRPDKVRSSQDFFCKVESSQDD